MFATVFQNILRFGFREFQNYSLKLCIFEKIAYFLLVSFIVCHDVYVCKYIYIHKMKNPSITNDISGLNLASNANQIGLCLINQRNYPFKLKISSKNHHSVFNGGRID